MKKLIFIALLCSLISCGLDDDTNQGFDFDLVPILDVELPDELKKDSIYNLGIRYLRPTNCHAFRGFDYNRNDNERIVAIVNTVARSEECSTLENDTVAVTLRLHVVQDDVYIFKFWQGKDADGENQFLVNEVPVITSQ